MQLTFSCQKVGCGFTPLCSATERVSEISLSIKVDEMSVKQLHSGDSTIQYIPCEEVCSLYISISVIVAFCIICHLEHTGQVLE